MTTSQSPFDPDATRYIEMIDQLELQSWRTRYSFTAKEDFESVIRNNPRKCNQIYWGEILARAHLTAATSILRSRHWVGAIVAAVDAKNLLSFSAALRGLIESAADTSTALLNIPSTFARDHVQITSALSGNLHDALFISSDMESNLIHFAYARHLTKEKSAVAPASHKAMHVRDYIGVLEQGQVTNVIDCYRTLCDLTHPGASSVWMWLHSVNDLELELNAGQDAIEIKGFLADYKKTILELVMYAFNPAIVTLRVLNYFPLAKFHVPELNAWNLSGLLIWRKCQAYLKGSTPKAGAQLRIVKPNLSLQPTPPRRRG